MIIRDLAVLSDDEIFKNSRKSGAGFSSGVLRNFGICGGNPRCCGGY